MQQPGVIGAEILKRLKTKHLTFLGASENTNYNCQWPQTIKPNWKHNCTGYFPILAGGKKSVTSSKK